MKLRGVTYGDRETRDEVPIPETVVVEMSIEEAIAVTEIAGRVLGPGQQQTSTHIWNSLTMVVNSHWESGIEEAVRDLGVHPWKFKAGTRDYG